uniref:(S)-ureidoglycine aminohydrolase cupin domain-containing protein n=1 Tax=Hemiselmis andersenii TaxID=464988 RepID=A0A7S0XV39_HEMAN
MRRPREKATGTMRIFPVFLLALGGAAAFTSPALLSRHQLRRPAVYHGAVSAQKSLVRATGRAGLRSDSLCMKAAPEPAKVIKAGSSEEQEVLGMLTNTGFWSCPPSTATMYLDNQEVFKLLQGKVTITAVTVTGRELGEEIEFDEGDCGIVPPGSYRWKMLKPTTKQTNCREGLQLTTKGWREEPPLKAMMGKGTLSIIGRSSEDDFEYLKKLITDKGLIPETAFENAIQYKLDKDIYLSNLSFAITDRGMLVKDRVTEEVLGVLDGEGFKDYNPDLDYEETERSKRWTKDGNFNVDKLTGK